MIAAAKFLFVICQMGAEAALKAEVAREWPDFRFAFSRPGFVTFKLPEGLRLAMDFDLRSTFARTYGFSLGKTSGQDARQLAQATWQMAEGLQPRHLHVWERDSSLPGDRGFEPGITTLAQEVGELIAQTSPDSTRTSNPLPLNQLAHPGELVLDCVLVEPHEWWIGYHRAGSIPSRWPGGVPPVHREAEVISRAYFKITEALMWSRLPIKDGDRCAEIGSAPGGSSQALLEHGLVVMGIDPAEMDEAITEHPNFVHIRKRAADLKRREFRDVRWLFADSNVAPKHTLDSIEAIVTHREIKVRGMLLTLKLLEWQLAEAIPEYLERVRSWGFEQVQARQLAFNRQEICVAAQRGSGRRSSAPGGARKASA